MIEWKQRVQKLRRFDVETTQKNPRGELIDISSILKVESTSNRCHNFHVDSPFKIDVISTNFPRGISTSNRWRIDEDVSIGQLQKQCVSIKKYLKGALTFSLKCKLSSHSSRRENQFFKESIRNLIGLVTGSFKQTCAVGFFGKV